MLWEISGGHNQFLEGGQARYLEGLNRFLLTIESCRKTPESKL